MAAMLHIAVEIKQFPMNVHVWYLCQKNAQLGIGRLLPSHVRGWLPLMHPQSNHSYEM